MPSLPYPYVGLSPQRLTDLINSDNGTALQLGVDFNFSTPLPYSDAAGRNTKVTMVPVDTSKYASTEVHYWRLPLTVLNDLPAGSVQPVQLQQVPFTLHQVLDAINTGLGLNLTYADVVDQTYATQQASYALHINEASSLAWIDSAFQFQAQFPAAPVNYYDYILDKFAGSGALSTHTGDSGVTWRDNGVYSATTNALIANNTLVTSPGAKAGGFSKTATLPAEHTVVLGFNVVIPPGDANFNTTITFQGGGPLSGYKVNVNLTMDGKISFSLSRIRQGVPTIVSAQANWTQGAHTLELDVTKTDTILKYDGNQVAETPGGVYVDSSTWGFTLDNGNEVGAVNISKTEVHSVGEMTTPPIGLWNVIPNAGGGLTNIQGKSSQVFTQVKDTNGNYTGTLLWTVDANKVIATNCETGAQDTLIDMATLVGNLSNVNYLPNAVDKNGLLWMQSWNGFGFDRGPLARVDLVNKVAKDQLYTGQAGATALNQCVEIEFLCYKPGADVMWGYMTPYPGSGRPNQIIAMNITDGSIAQSLPTTFYSSGVVMMDIDTTNNILWVFDQQSQTVSRLRALDLNNNGNVLATIANNITPQQNNSVYIPQYDEMVFAEYNSTLNAYRLNRIKGSTQQIIQQRVMTDPLLSDTSNSDFGGRKVLYNPATDEILVYVDYDPNWTGELWAFNRSDLSKSRVVFAGDAGGGGMDAYDYGIDQGGNIYVESLLDGSQPGRSQLFRLFRS